MVNIFKKTRKTNLRKSRKHRKTRRVRRGNQTLRRYRSGGGSLHPASTVIFKPDEESPYLMTDVETMKNIVEAQYI